MEIIHLVEESALSIKRTLDELEVPRSTFYRWYQKYQTAGYEGLADKKPNPRQFWNRIPGSVRQQVVEMALACPEQSPRHIAWQFVDQRGYFISESSVYRILKGFDLVQSPAFVMVSAKDKFEQPTTEVNELWQTDFTHFKVVDWGWYYLSTVLDDYSRYILAWKLSATMAASDVQDTLEMALQNADLQRVKVSHSPRLLSDNGPCYLSKALKTFLQRQGLQHIRGAPYHPMTQGKIERYHRSMKNLITLQNHYSPSELEAAIAQFVAYYNHQRYHESLDNMTPADVYFGRVKEVQTKRQEIKRKTLALRRGQNLQIAAI
jgi:transposase InsO family protein